VPAPPPTRDAQGNLVVTVSPGAMTPIQVQSAASAAASLAALTPIVLVAPSGGGVITVASDTPLVVPGNTLSPQNLGQPVPSIALGPALIPGAAKLTISWQDPSGTAQTSTMSISAT
jgi:hypothetical protein